MYYPAANVERALTSDQKIRWLLRAALGGEPIEIIAYSFAAKSTEELDEEIKKHLLRGKVSRQRFPRDLSR